MIKITIFWQRFCDGEETNRKNTPKGQYRYTGTMTNIFYSLLFQEKKTAHNENIKIEWLNKFEVQ